MPIAVTTLSARIKFTLPDARLGHDPSIYLDFDPHVTRPTETVTVPIRDLRPDIQTTATGCQEQLQRSGFGAMKHTSPSVDVIPSAEGTEKYLDECRELLREVLGCDRVVAWNSVVRRNDPAVKFKVIPKQDSPEQGFIPSTRLQPIAGVAHVDQDADWGHELCGRALGIKDWKRAQIVNIWRPLHGPVTNAPLAVLDYRYLPASDCSRHANQFGVGIDIHHSSQQQWAYIRHQNKDEILFLKCYDSSQGSDNSALFCGHVAVEVDGDERGVPAELVRPRESIEVRLVAVWE